MAAAISSAVPKLVRSIPDPISPPIKARMISVRLIFFLVFRLMARQAPSRKSTCSGGRMTESLFSSDVPATGRMTASITLAAVSF